MRPVPLESPHRRKHFEYFRSMALPQFNVCAPVAVDALLAWLGGHDETSFTIAMVYLITDAANAVPELRQRIRGDGVVEHDLVHPSFSVETNETDVFSFCAVPFQQPFGAFEEAAQAQVQRMRTDPSFEDAPGRDDFLFLSAMPWIAFTGITHASRCPQDDAVPRISWGKYERRCACEPTRYLPVSIQVHHALVDGRHLGRFYEHLEASLATPATGLS